MCRYFSCIVKRDLSVYWSKKNMSHEELLKEAGLSDDTLMDRDFVRIEITPTVESTITRRQRDWTFHVDEEDTLPQWFKDNREVAEHHCWDAWKESVQINLAINNERREGRDIYILARGSSRVDAWDSSHVDAWDSSHVDARGSSHVNIQSVLAIVRHNGKIYVSNDAPIIHCTEVKS